MTKRDAELARDHIRSFSPDPRNARTHNPRNVGMIERSLNEVGSGRSLVATREGVIIAGNATLDAAAAAGIEDAIVIETSGDKIIIHKRNDLSIDDPRATKLGLYDNRTAELATWDADVVADIFEHVLDASDFFTEQEQASLFGSDSGSSEGNMSGDSMLDSLLEYRVIVNAGSEQKQAELIAELESRGFDCKALIS